MLDHKAPGEKDDTADQNQVDIAVAREDVQEGCQE